MYEFRKNLIFIFEKYVILFFTIAINVSNVELTIVFFSALVLSSFMNGFLGCLFSFEFNISCVKKVNIHVN